MDWIKLNRAKQRQSPLFSQLTDSLRRAIQDGRLPAGYKLPSSRNLSEQLSVSRNIVMIAYEQLALEGYLEAKAGSGNYVASGARWTKLPVLNLENQKANFETDDGPTKIAIDFRPGVPALDLFPRRLWGNISRDVAINMKVADLSYTGAAGSIELRTVLAQHLRIYRGIECSEENIVITAGAAQAFFFLANMFSSRVSEIIMEEPCTKGIRDDFIKAGLKIFAVDVDEQGLQTSLLPKPNLPRVIFVTPSHQFPLGGVLPIQRRIDLISFVQKSKGYVIEDDYDSEYRHSGATLPTLQELAPENVIHVGTFSKMLFPGLRLGYAVLPSALVKDFVALKGALDLQCPIFDQLVLAKFIEKGHLRRHVLQMKKTYSSRRKALIQSLTSYFGEDVAILGQATGLHLIAEFSNYKFSGKIKSIFQLNGFPVYPVEEHAFVSGKHINQLILGYGNLSVDQIKKGVKKLSYLLKSNS